MLILVVVAKACPVSHASMRPALLCDWTYTLKIPPMTNLLQICQGRDEFSLPVVPPCFVSPHSHGIPTYSRQLTYALRHGILAPCTFPMPSAVHLRNSVLPGSHLSGLSGSAPFVLSPHQRFVLLNWLYFCTRKKKCQLLFYRKVSPPKLHISLTFPDQLFIKIFPFFLRTAALCLDEEKFICVLFVDKLY